MDAGIGHRLTYQTISVQLAAELPLSYFPQQITDCSIVVRTQPHPPRPAIFGGAANDSARTRRAAQQAHGEQPHRIGAGDAPCSPESW